MNNKLHKILVTGASGFLGGALIEELSKSGNFEIHGLQNNSAKSVKSIERRTNNIFSADITDLEALRRAVDLKGADSVVHAAGLAHQFGRVAKADFWSVNVKGTENVCRLAVEAGVGHLILISSVAVYGDHGSRDIDESIDCRPDGFYAASKLESETRAIDICASNDLKLTILRPVTIIGEGDRGNTARLIRLIDKNRFVWIGTGDNKKSLIHKTDAARGIIKVLLANPERGTSIYNLAAQTVSMREIVAVISGKLEKKTPRFAVPEAFVRGFFRAVNKTFSIEYLKKIEKTLDKWLSDDIFSGRKFIEKFGFEPEFSINEGLSGQVDYYLREKKGLL